MKRFGTDGFAIRCDMEEGSRIGQIVSRPQVVVLHGGEPVLDVDVDSCVQAWKKPFQS